MKEEAMHLHRVELKQTIGRAILEYCVKENILMTSLYGLDQSITSAVEQAEAAKARAHAEALLTANQASVANLETASGQADDERNEAILAAADRTLVTLDRIASGQATDDPRAHHLDNIGERLADTGLVNPNGQGGESPESRDVFHRSETLVRGQADTGLINPNGPLDEHDQ